MAVKSNTKKCRRCGLREDEAISKLQNQKSSLSRSLFLLSPSLFPLSSFLPLCYKPNYHHHIRSPSFTSSLCTCTARISKLADRGAYRPNQVEGPAIQSSNLSFSQMRSSQTQLQSAGNSKKAINPVSYEVGENEVTVLCYCGSVREQQQYCSDE